MKPDFKRPRGVWRVLCTVAAGDPYRFMRRHVSMAGYVDAYRGDA